MIRFWTCSILFSFLVSCSGSGVTVTKSETVEYLSRAFTKSKKWFRSTDGETISEGGPPPPSPFQPSGRQVIQKRSDDKLVNRMSRNDYNRAIKRLESSITELEKKQGKNNMEIGETFFTLGSMHQIQGNSKQAKVAFQQARSIFSSWLGSEHPRVWKLKTRISNLN
ncbi:tetratricopeptide repeat protein [Opitutales bacterium]|nr:tetratricopeptide repeat protein [Opitutales bacterium]